MRVSGKRGRSAAIAVVLLAAAQAACSQVMTGPPPPDPVPLDSAPAAVRDFLIKAKAADQIADPLARCLAFPDYPGTRWPAGLTTQQCDIAFGPRITRAQVQALLDQGAVAKLDALFAADLARHFSATDFSEVIHRDYRDFDTSDAADAQSQAWLEKAPDSAYAMVARAEVYRRKASQSRGTDSASATPRENLQRMGEFASLAAELYERAVVIEPRLLPAYVGMMDLAAKDSRPQLRERAETAMAKLDPGCHLFAGTRMWTLAPRWGGSVEEMLAYATELDKLIGKRPLLAIDLAFPAIDSAHELTESDRYADALQVLIPMTVASSNVELFEDIAKNQYNNDEPDLWPATMALVAASRFQRGDAWVQNRRGELLGFFVQDPAWALGGLEAVVASDPGNGRSHYLLGQVYKRLNRYNDAEKQFLAQSDDPKLRASALFELTELGLRQGKPALAQTYSDQYIEAFPEDPLAWHQRSAVLMFTGPQVVNGPMSEPAPETLQQMRAALVKFMALSAGETTPQAAALRPQVELGIHQIDAQLKFQAARK